MVYFGLGRPELYPVSDHGQLLVQRLCESVAVVDGDFCAEYRWDPKLTKHRPLLLMRGTHSVTLDMCQFGEAPPVDPCAGHPSEPQRCFQGAQGRMPPELASHGRGREREASANCT